MDNKDHAKSDSQFDASLPLPIADASSGNSGKPDPARSEPPAANAAADLIRKKIEAAYANEPSASVEAKDLAKLPDEKHLSSHQKFIMELTSSGKPLHEIQEAWHDYYIGLAEADKLEVWQEFYATHSQASPNHKAPETKQHGGADSDTEAAAISHASGEHHRRAKTRKLITPSHTRVQTLISRKPRSNPLHSLVFGLGVGCIVILIFLFSFFNERFIAPFIQPSRNVSNTQVITAGTVASASPQIIIPKINVQIPVVYGVNTIDESAVELALEGGVVHYADTAVPGQDGNVAIVGHSSNNIFNPGRYKFAFVLLSHLSSGDTFYLDKDGKRYTYVVYKKSIVSPSDVSVLGPQDKVATATLITCDPPGTSTNRLVVVGEQIDPNPSANTAASPSNGNLAVKSAIIPGNSPTLWSRFWHWLTN